MSAGPMGSGNGSPALRLSITSGYQMTPIVNDALAFDLPPSTRITSRAVFFGENERLELWSPNSCCHAYYPGIAFSTKPLQLFSRPPSNTRRSDGHLGRFDPTVNPQHWCSDRLWYPFIRREGDPTHLPEFIQISDALETTSGQIRLRPPVLHSLQHRLNTLLVEMNNTEQQSAILGRQCWDSRPPCPPTDAINELAQQTNLEFVIDFFAMIQRALKSMAAWVAFVKHRIEDPPGRPLPSSATAPSVQEDLLGCWINGAHQQEALWLLQCGVPCFVVHQFDHYLDFAYMEHLPKFLSLTKGTDVEVRAGVFPHSDHWALSMGLNIVHNDHDIWAAFSERESRWTDRCRSASWRQGWVSGERRDPVEVVSELVESSGRIVPPAVARVRQGRKWTHWKEEVGLDGRVRLVGGQHKEPRNAKIRFFDRAECRVIHFDDPVNPPRHYLHDTEVFGLPCPDIPFFYRTGAPNYGTGHQSYASKWMYPSRHPDHSHLTASLRVPVPITYPGPFTRQPLLPATRQPSAQQALPPSTQQAVRRDLPSRVPPATRQPSAQQALPPSTQQAVRRDLPSRVPRDYYSEDSDVEAYSSDNSRMPGPSGGGPTLSSAVPVVDAPSGRKRARSSDLSPAPKAQRQRLQSPPPGGR